MTLKFRSTLGDPNFCSTQLLTAELLLQVHNCNQGPNSFYKPKCTPAFPLSLRTRSSSVRSAAAVRSCTAAITCLSFAALTLTSCATQACNHTQARVNHSRSISCFAQALHRLKGTFCALSARAASRSLSTCLIS